MTHIKFEFGTKAQTLGMLVGNMSFGTVPKLMQISVREFEKNTEETVGFICTNFKGSKLAVRSSSNLEDGAEHSMAGYFESVLNVSTNDSVAVKSAIRKVIASYSGQGDDEILVQEMLTDVICAGVALTADLDTLAPYFIVNYEESGLTSTVASGGEGLQRTYVHLKGSQHAAPMDWMDNLFKQLVELETFFGSTALDVEFATDKQGKLYILQVRRIIKHGKQDHSSLDLGVLLRKVYKKIDKLQRPHPDLLGGKTIFGMMPDWNPVEIIGAKPKKLASTLYKELITDSTWASQRQNYGYRSLESHPLMVLFLGVPFIDVRVDFNSFLPADIDDVLAERLCNYYIKKLECSPGSHDKIEFDIVHSCYYLGLEKELRGLLGDGFTFDEICKFMASLRTLTINIIRSKNGLFRQDMNKIQLLVDAYDKVESSGLALIDRIYWHTEKCKNLGTLPFAGIARAAFIGIQLLNSFVNMKLISSKSKEKFLLSINTISKTLNEDLCKVRQNKISRDAFLGQYGHLRPGTYDIESLRYDENFDTYFGHQTDSASSELISEEFDFTAQEYAAIQVQLSKEKLDISSRDLTQFIRDAVEGREAAKLEFTKSLSKILALVDSLGSRYGIDRNELAFLDFREILKLYSDLDHRDMEKILRDNIELNKRHYEYTAAVKLPSLITKSSDVFSFFILEETPNYISNNVIEATVLSEEKIKPESDLKGKIMMIGSADPGYDYLFTKGIGGLITKFGGANSHMAIRCAELGLPAVIGAGEKLYADWQKSNILRIDCAVQKVLVIS